MARSTLFGYSIDDDNGKLVVTVNGDFAEEILRNLREQAKAGRGYLLSRLLPIKSLGRLLSRRVDLITPGEGGNEEDLDMNQIFSQGIDEGFGSFDAQMKKFRESLKTARGVPKAGSKSSRGRKRTQNRP